MSFRFDSLKLIKWRGDAPAPSSLFDPEVPHGFRRAATPKLGSYAGLAALGLLAALVLGLPELVALAAPFALLLGVGLAMAETPEVEVSVELERDRAIEGEALELRLVLETRRPVEQLDLLLSLPDGVTFAEGGNPASIRLVAEDRRELDYVLQLARWGAYSFGDLRLPAPALRAAGRPGAADQGVSAARADAGPPPPARDPGFHRESRRAREGRGERVRRPAAVRTGRPRPQDQLAGERAAWGAVGERAPRRAERGRDPLPRLVHRGTPGGRGNPRPDRAGSSGADRPLPPAQGPGRA